MRQAIWSVLLVMGVTLCWGCGSPSTQSTPPPEGLTSANQPAVHQGSTTGSINGISYEILGGRGQSVEVINNNIKITSGSNMIEIKEGRVSFNGKDRGPIKAGDSLVLDAEAQLLVNNERR